VSLIANYRRGRREERRRQEEERGEGRLDDLRVFVVGVDCFSGLWGLFKGKL